jgi:hypothetical protein
MGCNIVKVYKDHGISGAKGRDLPKPIILHPWPSDRFAVTHLRWEPYAGKLHVRIWAGGAR